VAEGVPFPQGQGQSPGTQVRRTEEWGPFEEIRKTGEAKINEAIRALKTALEAVDEVVDLFMESEVDWPATAAGIERCLKRLTSKPAKQLAKETWG